MHSHCEQWSTFNLRKLPFPLILPIYVASKDFLELMVRLDKILISTTVKKNIIVVYCFSRWSLFFLQRATEILYPKTDNCSQGWVISLQPRCKSRMVKHRPQDGASYPFFRELEILPSCPFLF